MRDRLNPLHSSYIFKKVLSRKGLPIWANKTLNILDCLPEETLDKILSEYKIDIVQVPFNIFDRRLIQFFDFLNNSLNNLPTCII